MWEFAVCQTESGVISVLVLGPAADDPALRRLGSAAQAVEAGVGAESISDAREQRLGE